jgi:hypothetical protein
MTPNKNPLLKMFATLAPRADFVCQFCSKNSLFVKKSTLVFWQSLETQNDNFTHFCLIL